MGEDQSTQAGDTFGPYKLESMLGKGGMGEVYRAHDTGRDRIVALKLLPHHLAGDPVFQERFRRECQTVARLDEPHVIPIHDFGEINGQLFLDMRLVNGRDLRTILRERGTVTPLEAVALIEQVAAALDAAHEAGLIHRDVKPENVLVTSADFAYLVDFGVAHADSDTHLTKTGTAIGSISYMAPEQFSDAPLTKAIDVYALTAVLFELLTGRQPYPGKSITTVTKGVLFDAIPTVTGLVPSAPQALDQVVAWGLAKDPADRCPSTLELAKAARLALSGHAPTGPVVVASAALTDLTPTPGAGPTTRIPSNPNIATTNIPGPTDMGRTMSGPTASGPTVSGPVPAYASTQTWQSGPVQQYPQVTPPPMQPPYQQPAPAQPTAKSGSSPLLIGAVIALIAALAAVGAWLAIDKLGSSDTPGTTAATPAHTTVIDGTTLTSTETVTETPTSATPVWTPGPPPADNEPCAGYTGVGTGYPQWTGCEFAANVRDSYVAGGPMGQARTVNGWAPQMQKNFVMECTPYLGIIACRGGNQAVVYIY